MPVTIRTALTRARSRLEPHGCPASDAEELLSRALHIERGALRLEPERLLDRSAASVFEGWLDRRLAGEPVQYITGFAAFRSLDLHVDPRVLIPRPETEGLVEAVLSILRHEAHRWPAPRVLDLGTGSGAIALAIAHECPTARVTATDASPDALAVATANAASVPGGDRVQFEQGHWLDALGADDRFEVIVSNPPYVADDERDDLPRDVVGFEPEAALFSGPDGLDALREIVEGTPRHLVTHGLLALEVSERRARDVLAWFEGARAWEGVELEDDLAGQPRVLLARREAGPAIAPLQWPEE